VRRQAKVKVHRKRDGAGAGMGRKRKAGILRRKVCKDGRNRCHSFASVYRNILP